MSGLLIDLRYGLRSLRRSPGLVATASVCVALAVAANGTMFAALDAIVFNPFDLPNRNQLVVVWSSDPDRGLNHVSTLVPDFLIWREQARTVALAAYRRADHNWSAGGEPARLSGIEVTGGFLSIHGIAPLLGREISRTDETSGEPVVLVSEALWRDRYAADARVLGRSMRLDGVAHTIIGVVPAKYRLPSVSPGVWTPLAHRGGEAVRVGNVAVVGRLQGAPAVAEREMRAIAKRVREALPGTNARRDVRIESYYDAVVSVEARQAGTIILAAMTLVLLIACANVANLLLARATGRTRELAIRAAMGAGRGRIVRELLIESSVLALIGGASGVLLSLAGVALLRGIFGWTGQDFHLSERVVLFSTGVTVLASLMFGLVPAIKAAQSDTTRSLRDGGRSATVGVPHGRLRAALVIAEIALALPLLVAGGLTIKSAIRAQRVDLGFRPDGVVAFRTVLSPLEFPDSTSILTFQEQLNDRLRRLPGVVAVGAASELPLNSNNMDFYAIVGEPEPGPGNGLLTRYHRVSPGYLATIGVAVSRGREFETRDRQGATPVVLVNHTFAERHWPGGSAVGRKIRLANPGWGDVSNRTLEIVGVIPDIREQGYAADPEPAIYLSAAQFPSRWMVYTVRSTRSPDDVLTSVRRVVAEIAPGQPLFDTQTLRDYVRFFSQDTRVLAQLLGLLGMISLLLSVAGVYGVIAYAVGQRIHEIGIRRAVGAQTSAVLSLVLREGGGLIGTGSAIGVALAVGTGQAISRLLFGVSPRDPVIFIVVTVTLGATALLATLGPARRAARIEPTVALRAD